MSVKLELYRVFKEVAEVGNITAAAQALYISQSAVSPVHQAAGARPADSSIRAEQPWRDADRRGADAV